MTIAVVWQEDGFLWSAADTRLVDGKKDSPITEIAAKIYVIPVMAYALVPNSLQRLPVFGAQYGFIYAGSAFPATMTAVTASTLLQNLVRIGNEEAIPAFEDLAKSIKRLAKRFMQDRRQQGGNGLFQAAFFGWCHHKQCFKVAQIDGRDDAGGFRVELFFPEVPRVDGEPWIVLGSAASAFHSAMNEYRKSEPQSLRLPRRVIDKMIVENIERSVGGSTSLGYAYKNKFQLVVTIEPVEPRNSAARRSFNGLDLDQEVGFIGRFIVGTNAVA